MGAGDILVAFVPSIPTFLQSGIVEFAAAAQHKRHRLLLLRCGQEFILERLANEVLLVHRCLVLHADSLAQMFAAQQGEEAIRPPAFQQGLAGRLSVKDEGFMRRSAPADVKPAVSPGVKTVEAATAAALDLRDLCFALALGMVVLLIWLHAAGPGAGAGFDFFTAYWRAAGEVAAGTSPYQQLARLTINPGASGLSGTGYVYPPFLAVLLSIPVRLGFNKLACWLLWTLVNVTAVIWMGYELNLSLRNSNSWTGSMAFVVAALLPAVVTYDIGLGQADLLMVALAVGSYGLWLRGHRWSASVILGVAIAIKPTLGLVLFVWLWKGDWRAFLRGAVAAVILVFLPFAVIGLDAFREYVTFLLHWNAFGANADFINQTPYALLLRMFTINPAVPPLLVAPFLVQPLRLAATAGTCGSGCEPHHARFSHHSWRWVPSC